MSKTIIYCVESQIPIDDAVHLSIRSTQALDDADIIVFTPTVGGFGTPVTEATPPQFNQSSHATAMALVDHWRSEIGLALQHGKTVIVLLAVPTRYVHKEIYSNYTEHSTYDILPLIRNVAPKTGKLFKLATSDKAFAQFWGEFSSAFRYNVEVSGQFEPILKSKSGSKILGGVKHYDNGGSIYFLPLMSLNPNDYIAVGTELSEAKERQVAKRIRFHFEQLAKPKNEKESEAPKWVGGKEFEIPAESLSLKQIESRKEDIAALETQILDLRCAAEDQGQLKSLLFENGEALEVAVRKALEIIGFKAEGFENNTSEFDVVFSSSEGRFLGECEGRDNSSIAAGKIRQLTSNIIEDYERPEITSPAKPVLFGNGYRFIKPSDREECFTTKCIEIAKSNNVALVRTIDLFFAARYVQENPHDETYAKECRKRLLTTIGTEVAFPSPPT